MSANSVTTNIGLSKIDFNTRGWAEEEYANLDVIDGIVGQLMAEGANFGFGLDTSVSANTVTLTLDPVLEAYTTGYVILFRIANAVTGTTTININGLGAKTVKKLGADLVTGDIPANAYVKAIYDGTNFLLIEPMLSEVEIDDGSITPAKLSTGAPDWDVSGNIAIDGGATVAGTVSAGTLKEGTKKALVHDSASYTSGKIIFSTADPSGGENGDIWFKYA